MLLKNKNYILKGTINQSNKQFKESADKQCTAICAYAIAFSSIIPVQDWNTHVLDRIIKEGNFFYNYCQTSLRQKNIIYNAYLAVDEILEDVHLNSQVLKLSQYLDFEYDNTRQGQLGSYDIIKHMEEFLNILTDCLNLILIVKNYSFAIIKHLDYVYFLDSHENYGKSCGSNAYVKKFHKTVAPQEIYKHLVDLFLSVDFTYTISFIEVCPKINY